MPKSLLRKLNSKNTENYTIFVINNASTTYSLAYHIDLHSPLQVITKLLEKLDQTDGTERKNYLHILSHRIEDNVCDSFDGVKRSPSIFDVLIARLKETGTTKQLAKEYESRLEQRLGCSIARI